MTGMRADRRALSDCRYALNSKNGENEVWYG